LQKNDLHSILEKQYLTFSSGSAHPYYIALYRIGVSSSQQYMTDTPV